MGILTFKFHLTQDAEKLGIAGLAKNIHAVHKFVLGGKL